MPPVYSFLDLSTGHVTHDEWEAVCRAWPALDDAYGPRVIKHEYGAWVNVPGIEPAGALTPEEAEEFTGHYPNVGACLTRARELGCTWINFDQDAEQDEALPTFEW